MLTVLLQLFWPATAWPSAAVHVGDRLTQSEALDYLFSPPSSGDWAHYRLTVDGKAVLEKMVGFGSERLGDKDVLYVETSLKTPSIIDLPVPSSRDVAADTIDKTYVDAPAFGDLALTYKTVGVLEKVGDSVYDVPVLIPFSLLSELPFEDLRPGTVFAVDPQVMTVGAKTVQAVHIELSFPGDAVPGGVRLAPFVLQLWQSPDVPLATTQLQASLDGHVYQLTLTDYGRGTYRTAISERLGGIHSPPKPQ
ncbi:MAG: hypothetical protein GIW99_05060 [Candidatus Eremiobacteraeota bacterium]|nr:hypothetical protein [Candidatus Eremiobacteraeota bacterium]MBC5827035.1 hypothetical protein [Candidatus Eremiobacteraeota bacterium]